MAEILTPQIAFPLRLNATGTDAVVNEQDSDDDVMDCVEVLVSTERGERVDLPDYGIDDPTFTQGEANTDDIISAIGEHEPRADIDFEHEDDADDLIDRIRLRVKGRSDDA